MSRLRSACPVFWQYPRCRRLFFSRAFQLSNYSRKSSELRAVAVKAYGAGVSRQQIADILGYHLNSVSRWIREFEREKRLEARPRGHRVSIFSEAERLELVELIGKQPDIT